MSLNTVIAGDVVVSWDPNSESDLAKYEVFMGEASGIYINSVDVGTQTQFTWQSLEAGKTYYFAVTAWDQAGNESGFSEEVNITINSSDTTPPSPLTASLLGETALDILFSEPLSKQSVEVEANYSINNGVQVIGAVIDDQNLALVHFLTTTHPLGTDFTVTINNIQDLTGNTISANSTANYRSPDAPIDPTDTTSPQLVNAVLTDLTHLDVPFSEKIDRASAEQKSNYTIDQGVDVLQASLNSAQTKVTLTTSTHFNGVRHKLTVNQVKDLAGNAIFGNSSISYEANVDDGDNTPPEVASVIANGFTQIDINFSEPLEKTSAEDEVNFAITPNVEIIGAFLDDNATTVHLLTGSHITNIEYSVSVSNIRDLSSTPNIMTSSSSSTYTFEPDDDGSVFPQPTQLPKTFALVGNYPNPFNPETEIKFFLERNREVELKVYNMLGQLVKTLVKDELTAGFHSLKWDGTNRDNLHVPSGIYIYSLEVKKEVAKGDMLVNVSIERRVKRMTLLK